MRCSVALCTRNGELFLEQQLASVVGQKRKLDEVVICDDASSDRTVAIIAAFAEVARNQGVDVRVFRHASPLGVSGNFEFACRQATGDVIFLADQDDVWHGEKVARILSVFEDPAVVLVNSDARLVDAEGHATGESLFEKLRLDGRERRALAQGDLAKVGAYKNLFTGATVAFRASLMGEAFPFPENVHHDDWLAQIAWLSGGEVRTLFEPLIDYRLHAANTVGLGSTEIARPPSERLGHYLAEQERRLAPVIAWGEALNGMGNGSVERLRLRQRQLELTRRRMAYSQNPVIRARQVLNALSEDLYASMFNPWRTAFLDLFRSTK